MAGGGSGQLLLAEQFTLKYCNLSVNHAAEVQLATTSKGDMLEGDVMVCRYADDAVLGFQHREEAEQFLEQLQERLAKFGLEFAPGEDTSD